MHGLPDFPFLASGSFKHERANIFRAYSVNPRREPERGNSPITKCYFGSNVIELHIYLITRVSHPHPKFLGVAQFIPRPSKTHMTRAKNFFEVKNPLASKVFGHANRLLVDLAFSS
jgi:hypothetical protein